jgi:hypothetical protein
VDWMQVAWVWVCLCGCNVNLVINLFLSSMKDNDFIDQMHHYEFVTKG